MSAPLPSVPEEAVAAIYGVLVDHPYHCQNECCEFSHEREVAFGGLVDDAAAAAVPAILRWAADQTRCGSYCDIGEDCIHNDVVCYLRSLADEVEGP